MPLSTNPATNSTADKLVRGMRAGAGDHPGHRPGHARGRLTTGTFTPTAEAASLSNAPHFSNESTPVIVRFSSSTGFPNIPDTDPNANPRGLAIRFDLGNDGHKHTDIVAHSFDGFPARTGEEFLALLTSIGDGSIGEFLGKNPAAAYFVQTPKPTPVSFATQNYFGVNAFRFVSKDGKDTFIRYRIVPEAGYHVLSESDLASKPKDYLFDELVERLSSRKISFKLLAVIAEDGDVTDDATKRWPEDRKNVELGTIVLDAVKPETESFKEQKRIIFDPIPRVDGIEASDDPMLEMRADVYLISGRQRRAAPDAEVTVAAVT